jgi:hypothetical protein
VRKLLAALVPAAAGLGMAVAVAAGASAAVQPMTSYLATKTANGNEHNYACTPVRTIKNPAIPIVYIKNNCSTQVFLQEGQKSECLSPGVIEMGSVSPSSITISGRTGACAASGNTH